MRVLDRADGARARRSAPADCGFAYRSSAFKREPGRWVVLAVSFAPARRPSARRRSATPSSRATLGVEAGARAPLAEVREAVLGLRRGKGMVLDPGDADTVSAGSFFTNPVLDAGAFAALRPAPRAPGPTRARRLARGRRRASRRRPPGSSSAPASTAATATRSGIAISAKHTLALTNRGAGTTAELVALAREIADGVRERLRRRARARAGARRAALVSA